jgi:rod shape-determining protein MreB
MSVFSNDVAIDLGTANTVVYVPSVGVVVNEPSVVAVENNGSGRKVLAVGKKARLMVGRVPGKVETVTPLCDGVIADFIAAEEMMRYFLANATSKISLMRPRVMICVPSGATPVERRAVVESAYSAGARKVLLIEESVAAAIGAGTEVNEPRGSMVIDIGGGTTDIAVISLGGVIFSRSIRVAGNAMDSAIIKFIRDKHRVLIGETSAEFIKKDIGAAPLSDDAEQVELNVTGRDLRDGMPKKIILDAADMAKCLRPAIEQIAAVIKNALEEMPPELAADIVDNGAVLTGGCALLKNIDTTLAEITGINLRTVENALECVAIGTGLALENAEEYKNFLTN